MSISLVLVPLAIAVSITAKESLAIIAENRTHAKSSSGGQLSAIETRFNSDSLLVQTLIEHGVDVKAISENHIICNVGNAQLEYTRQDASQSFLMSVHNVEDVDCLLDSINLFEQEYDRNVQSFTYGHLMSNLGNTGMQLVDEEVLEDHSILLTINA